MQARQKHNKLAFSKLPPISRGPSAETEKFEHTGGPGSYVKSPSQRSTSPQPSPQQQMTHNMMTRSKTRAAAVEVEKYNLISYACEFLRRATIDKHKNRIELWVYMLNLHVKNLV
jgi:hypothetical protein